MDTPDQTIGARAESDPEIDDDLDDPELPDVVTLGEVLPMSQYAIPQGEWDAPPSDRVRYALDMLLIAAAERAIRILRSDLGA